MIVPGAVEGEVGVEEGAVWFLGRYLVGGVGGRGAEAGAKALPRLSLVLF